MMDNKRLIPSSRDGESENPYPRVVPLQLIKEVNEWCKCRKETLVSCDGKWSLMNSLHNMPCYGIPVSQCSVDQIIVLNVG